MSTTRRALALVLMEGNGRFLIDSVGVVVLARLLTPAEVGIFSIAYGFAALGHIFRELGVGPYLIQEKDLTPDRLRAAFTVTLVMAWAVAVTLAIGSRWMAEFYQSDELRWILLILAFNFLLVPFGSVALALLRRRLDFARLVTINLMSAVVNTATSIALAATGTGSMSLAWGSTAGLVATVAMSARAATGVPRLPGTRDLRRVLSFGAWSTGGSAASQAGISGPDMIIGKVLGPAATGLFSKAYGIVDSFNRLVLRSVTTFTTPHFAARKREGLEVSDTYLYGVALITGLAWPFFAVAALCSGPLIHVLLGDQWLGAAPVVGILCVSAAISATFAPFQSLLISTAGAKAYATYTGVAASSRIVAVLATAWLGLEAVGCGLVAASGLAAIWALRALRRHYDVSPVQLWRSVRKSLALAAAALGGAALGAWGAASLELAPWLALVVPFTAGAISFLVAVTFVGHPLRRELEHAVGPIRRRLQDRKEAVPK